MTQQLHCKIFGFLADCRASEQQPAPLQWWHIASSLGFELKKATASHSSGGGKPRHAVLRNNVAKRRLPSTDAGGAVPMNNLYSKFLRATNRSAAVNLPRNPDVENKCPNLINEDAMPSTARILGRFANASWWCMHRAYNRQTPLPMARAFCRCPNIARFAASESPTTASTRNGGSSCKSHRPRSEARFGEGCNCLSRRSVARFGIVGEARRSVARFSAAPLSGKGALHRSVARFHIAPGMPLDVTSDVR